MPLRFDAPAPRSLRGKGAQSTVSVNRYLYGDDAETRAADAERRWRDWLAATFGG